MKRPSARTRANRLKASKSTGPRTAAGKARVSRNALVHGLRASSLPDDPRVERLARLIAGPDAAPERLALAREIALADDAVRRARHARLLFMENAPDGTLEELCQLARELRDTTALDARIIEYGALALLRKVYKGRPLKIYNYPRFRRMFRDLEKLPMRTEQALMPRETSQPDPMFLPQARLLARYEADAMRRRKLAVAAFDAYCRREGAQVSDEATETGAPHDQLS